MFSLVYNSFLFFLAFLFFYKLLTKQDFSAYALLVFFLYFGLRVARVVKVEDWEMLYEFLFLFVSFLFALTLHNYLPRIFTTRLWQTFFVGGLVFEEWYTRNFPFSLFPLGVFSFSAGAWWSILGGNTFLYLFVVFLLAFYLSPKPYYIRLSLKYNWKFVLLFLHFSVQLISRNHNFEL